MKNSLLSILAALALAGCSNSFDGMDTLSADDIPANEPRLELQAEVEPEAPPAGFMAKILQRVSPGSDPAPVETDVPLAQVEPFSAADVEAAPPKRRGLLSRLRRTDTAAEIQPGQDVAQQDVQIASLAPIEEKSRPLQTLRGMFGPRAQKTGTGAEIDVTPGLSLPFGQVARACAVTKQGMGQRIDKASHGFALYDSRPGATTPRDFFITGFSDGCPRQFTAALAIFGAPAMHEQLRYGRPSEQYPYSDTDKAYEKVKMRVCGVSRRQPCGAKISRLERNTVFISTYERFTDNGRWADILVHDGEVLAASLKDL